jgi:hypothetical protein
VVLLQYPLYPRQIDASNAVENYFAAATAVKFQLDRMRVAQSY